MTNRKYQIVLLFIIGLSTCTIPQPNLKERTVHMKDTITKIYDYVKNGMHQKLLELASIIPMDQTIGRCGPKSPQPFKFLGFTVASLNSENPESEQWDNYCFKENKATFRWLDSKTAQVTITTNGRRTDSCSDTYALTDIFNHDVKVIDTNGEHVITYKFSDDDEITFVKLRGLKLLRLCDSHVNLLPDMLMTLGLFISDPILGEFGAKVPKSLNDFVYKQHYRWLHKWQGQKLMQRDVRVEVDASMIKQIAKDGDIMCLFLGTGLSSLVMWGTGGRCSHIAMVIWGKGDDEGELFVLQSNENGISKSKIEEFWEEEKKRSIVLLPMSPAWRKKFDTEKAMSWFDSLGWQKYGYANFLFSAIDTPEDNYPQIVGADAFSRLMMYFNEIPLVGRRAVDLIWTRALNKRLGTEGLDYGQVVLEAAKRGMSIGELAAIPEKEEWM